MDAVQVHSKFIKISNLSDANFDDSKLVHGYIHMIEKEYTFNYEMPLCIFEICLVFYYEFYNYIPFDCSCKSMRPKYNKIKPTPFSLLSAIYGMKKLMELQIWVSIPLEAQCEYLKKSEINTEEGCEQIVTELHEKYLLDSNVTKNVKYLLMMHGHQSELLSNDITKWSADDIIVSFIYFFINFDGVNKVRYFKTIQFEYSWVFIERLRSFLDDIRYPGQMIYDFFNVCTNYGEKPGGFGLKLVQKVCNHYQLMFGKYAKIKKYIYPWAEGLVNKTYQLRNSLPK